MRSTALGLGSVNLGGFVDRDIDRFLGLDGVAHSILYLIGIGQGTAETDGPAEESE